jgi:hypothetical protein
MPPPIATRTRQTAQSPRYTSTAVNNNPTNILITIRRTESQALSRTFAKSSRHQTITARKRITPRPLQILDKPVHQAFP